ncbi:hypothetical protein [Clostridium sp.]|uniref:hypothetical protein n=1 Tax=Clostridium sp. TaxID=1506 RepID=UPI002634B87A|nr:hypothetical protein [Clostridium sp.]
MKSKIIKKVVMSSLCLTLCFGLIQSNVMAAEVKGGQVSNSAKLVEIQDGKQKRKDIVISEADKEAVLSNKLSSKDFIKKYGNKNNINTTTSSAVSISLESISAASYVSSSTTGSGSLSNSFYFLSDSSLYGGDQSLLSAWLGNDTGCGPIAGCNILAYHAKYYGRSGYTHTAGTKAVGCNIKIICII